MTSETHTTIQLSDLKAIELECKECHARIVRPIGLWQSNSFLCCSECGATWATFRGTMDFLAKFSSQVGKIAIAVDQSQDGCPFIVRFEIETGKKP